LKLKIDINTIDKIVDTMSVNIQIISIEGNIGSGKSTLLANLKDRFKNNKRIIFLREPVDEWSKITDESGVTILEKFYKDQHKYSFSFQMMAYISRLKLLKDAIKDIRLEVARINSICANHEWSKHEYVIITERSLYTDKMVFAKMLYDTGKMEDVNYQIYLNWFDMFSEEFTINKIIYVRADPEICHERINIRHRDGENNIPLDYLQACSEYHENMLDKTNTECVCKNQMVLNGNYNIYENENILKDWLENIETFIKDKI